MNILLTFDYELFFGSIPGSQDKSIISPTKQLLALADRHEVPMCFFVDAGYVLKLKQNAKHVNLKEEKEALESQLKAITKKGHEIQLHVHPHWEDTYFKGGQWQMNLTRYKLSDFHEEKIGRIIKRYKECLDQTGCQDSFVYRAGGWSIQPFEKIGKALSNNGINIDSTIFPGGYYYSVNQSFDFRSAPNSTNWHFDDDPCRPTTSGSFREIPISSIQLSPLFFWKLAFHKLTKDKQHKPLGDGKAASASKAELVRMLTLPSCSPVSTDGYKSVLLQNALGQYQNEHGDNANFVTIGHPKAMTPFSLAQLESFIASNKHRHNFVTYYQLLNKDG